MPFAIPNSGVASFQDQAAPDKVDFDILSGADAGTGVVSGCAVTPSSGMTVAIAAGTVMVSTVSVPVAGTTATAGAADATNPRFDLVVVSNAGVVSITAGTPAAVPVFPAIPANSVVLASLYIPVGTSTVDSTRITDKRVSVNFRSPASRTYLRTIAR